MKPLTDNQVGILTGVVALAIMTSGIGWLYYDYNRAYQKALQDYQEQVKEQEQRDKERIQADQKYWEDREAKEKAHAERVSRMIAYCEKRGGVYLFQNQGPMYYGVCLKAQYIILPENY